MVPAEITREHLDLLVRQLQTESLKASSRGLSDEERLEQMQALSVQKYSYFVGDVEVSGSLETALSSAVSASSPEEDGVRITFAPQALFRVRAATRCASTMAGHAEAVLSVSFSPDGQRLASGSGDATVRFWDTLTSTSLPCQSSAALVLYVLHSLETHSSWVMAISWSPDGSLLASGSMDGSVQVWSGQNGAPVGRLLRSHAQCITQLAWQPLHLAEDRRGACLLASASKDHLVKVWDPLAGSLLFTLSQHTDTVTCVRWSGSGFLYSGSRDRSVRMWDMREGLSQGTLLRVLTGHAHWINSMALSEDYVLRTGPFDPASLVLKGERNLKEGDWSEKKAMARSAYSSYCAKHGAAAQGDRLVTSSDDFTLILWSISPMAAATCGSSRMTGHQALVTQAVFSPDGRYIASCSFDKSVKLWDGLTGKFLGNLRGHVGPVYQLAWSSDSRLLVSGSRDSTLKLWDVSSRRLKMNLPGHLDEVYAVDWSPDGLTVASGSKDKTVKLWRH